MGQRSQGSTRVVSATRLANWVLDRTLGIRRDRVLNRGPAAAPVPNPAHQLRKLANQMQTAAVDPQSGLVDYASLANSQAYAHFRKFAGDLSNYQIDELGPRAERISFWVNLYNALIVHGVIDQQINTSVLGDLGFFRRVAYNIGGLRFSADDIEHGVLRGNARHPYLPFRQFAPDDPRLAATIGDPDPRIHFTLVCGAHSCPPIAVYDASRLEAQLDQAAAAFITGQGAQLDPGRQELWLSRIFKWYEDDFGGREAVRQLVARHLPEYRDLEQARMKYLPYDWSLNGTLQQPQAAD